MKIGCSGFRIQVSNPDSNHHGPTPVRKGTTSWRTPFEPPNSPPFHLVQEMQLRTHGPSSAAHVRGMLDDENHRDMSFRVGKEEVVLWLYDDVTKKKIEGKKVLVSDPGPRPHLLLSMWGNSTLSGNLNV